MPTTPSKTTTSQTNQQLADLWVLHHEPVRTYLIARAGRGADHALIDDAIASTIEILIHRLRHGSPIASIGGWLRVVAWHEYLRLIRRHRHRRLDRLPIDTLTELADDTEDLPAALGRRQAARDLEHALEKAFRELTVFERQLLNGFYEGHSYKKLARELGLTENAVGKILTRTRQTLSDNEALREAHANWDRDD